MKRNQILGKLIFDYRKFFTNQEVDDYKKQFSDFIKANESLNDEAFYEKFKSEFSLVPMFNSSLDRHYLSKIESAVNTIKIIAIIYLVASIIGAIIIASQLTP
jgi:hypothetical protein